LGSTLFRFSSSANLKYWLHSYLRHGDAPVHAPVSQTATSFALDPTSEPQLQRIRRSPFLPSTPRRRPPLQGLERSVHWVSQSEKQAGPARNHGGILGVEQSQGSELLDHAHPLPLRAWGRSAPRILELAHDHAPAGGDGDFLIWELGFGRMKRNWTEKALTSKVELTPKEEKTPGERGNAGRARSTAPC